jgi:putative aldouronate transport system permease protein
MLSRQEKAIQGFAHIILILASAACVIPFIILIMASVSSEETLIRDGYQLLPKVFSLDAYKYLYHQGASIIRAYGITVFTTVVGTSISLLITLLIAYPLSMRRLPGKGWVMFLLVFSMLFNGGLVPTYIMYTQYFHLKNSIWAYIIPGKLLGAFNVLLIRSYFISSVPGEIIEAARIDGAGEYAILFRIVVPISTPILATIGLLNGLGFWNDWYNGLIYITNDTLYSLQVLLNAILTNVQYLANNEAGQRMNIQLPSASIRMAIAAIAVVPILIIYPFFQKYFVKSITMGAVKG